MVDATRRLLETVNAVKDTGEVLFQMIENHQKMLEMSRRVEKGVLHLCPRMDFL